MNLDKIDEVCPQVSIKIIMENDYSTPVFSKRLNDKEKITENQVFTKTPTISANIKE